MEITDNLFHNQNYVLGKKNKSFILSIFLKESFFLESKYILYFIILAIQFLISTAIITWIIYFLSKQGTITEALLVISLSIMLYLVFCLMLRKKNIKNNKILSRLRLNGVTKNKLNGSFFKQKKSTPISIEKRIGIAGWIIVIFFMYISSLLIISFYGFEGFLGINGMKGSLLFLFVLWTCVYALIKILFHLNLYNINLFKAIFYLIPWMLTVMSFGMSYCIFQMTGVHSALVIKKKMNVGNNDNFEIKPFVSYTDTAFFVIKDIGIFYKTRLINKYSSSRNNN